MRMESMMRPEEAISNMINPRAIGLLSVAAAHAVVALRVCVLCHKQDRDPTDMLTQRFGNALAARRFRVLFATIGAAWPETFMTGRPCCPRLSPDEAMFADMIEAVAKKDRTGFDRVTQEMHGSDAREALFSVLSAFDRARSGAVRADDPS